MNESKKCLMDYKVDEKDQQCTEGQKELIEEFFELQEKMSNISFKYENEPSKDLIEAIEENVLKIIKKKEFENVREKMTFLNDIV